MFPHMIQGNNVVVYVKGTPYTVRKGDLNYDALIQALKDGDDAAVEECVDPRATLINYGQGKITIEGDQLSYEGHGTLDSALSRRVIKMYKDGFSIEPMVKFIENLMENPSKRAVEELYGFLEKANLPITEDGCFLAYKNVNNDFTDIHSGTFDNSPGKVCEMPRNQVDEDRDRTCSTGLHFCSESYLPHFGAGRKTVVLKINPRDVVSIPADYNDAKGRCCRYEVLSELGVDPAEAFDKAVQNDANTVA